MYSMYFVFSYFICPVYCSIDTNACQCVRIKKLLKQICQPEIRKLILRYNVNYILEVTHNTTQYKTIHYNTIQNNTMQNNTMQNKTIQHNIT